MQVCLEVIDLSPTAYHSDPWDAVITPERLWEKTSGKDRDYRTLPPSRLATFSPSATKPVKAMTKTKEKEGLKGKVVPSAAIVQNSKIKAKMDGDGDKKASSRKPSGGFADGTKDKERKASADNGDHYHHIETLVSSSSNEGAPIETLDYGKPHPNCGKHPRGWERPEKREQCGFWSGRGLV